MAKLLEHRARALWVPFEQSSQQRALYLPILIQGPLIFIPIQGETEVNLYLTDQLSTGSQSGQQTPTSQDLETGDLVISNFTVVVEKDPHGLVEVVSQQLEQLEHLEHQDDGNEEHELQDVKQDTLTTNQDTTQPEDVIQDIHLQDTDNTAVVVIDTSSL